VKFLIGSLKVPPLWPFYLDYQDSLLNKIVIPLLKVVSVVNLSILALIYDHILLTLKNLCNDTRIFPQSKTQFCSLCRSSFMFTAKLLREASNKYFDSGKK